MEITFELVSARLIRMQLEAGIDQLERDANSGRYNTLCIRQLGRVAMALGHHEVCERAILLLQVAPAEAFLAGTITNIQLPATPPEGMQTLGAYEEWKDDFPPYQEAKTVEHIKSLAVFEEHIALCLKGRFTEARAKAGSGRHLEEVGVTLAILGKFDNATSIACDSVLGAFRQQGVWLVLVIELFRRRRTEESTTLLKELQSAALDTGDRIHLALGFAGREPWGGYPYPDW
jgi:hypothetical protein